MRLSKQLRHFPVFLVVCFFSVPVFASDTAENGGSWQQRCSSIRTSYNPATDLRVDALTIEPTDLRWPAFLAWLQARQIVTFTLLGLSTDTSQAAKGIVFRWALETPWEQDVISPFGQAIAHLLVERHWRDADFPQFFSTRGGIYGINIAERLQLIDSHSLAPWQQFFSAITAPTSSFTPLLQARLSTVAPDGQSVTLTLGSNRIITYSAARLLLDLRSVLTDCKIHEFLQLYDQQPSHTSSTSTVQGQSAPVLPTAVPSPSQPLETLHHDRAAYDNHCGGCHGLNGDGKGLQARTLQPPPRDFTKGLYRYRSTPTGQLPTDEDLLRAITQGLPGSMMPAWEPFLTTAERQALVAYIKSFSPRFTTDAPREALSIPAPPPVSAERVAHGGKLYRDSGCGSCHGEAGKGDGRAGKDLKSAEGDLIAPRDLTNKWGFRGGHTAQEVFLRLSTGMDGSPMASYRDVFSPDELWDLTFYVLSRSPPERPQVKATRSP